MDGNTVSSSFVPTTTPSIATILHVAVVFLTFAASGAPTAAAQAAGGSAEASVCIYQDRAFSVGAAICPHARFMLMCSQENDKLIWKIVGDPTLSNRCMASTLRADVPIQRRFVRRVSVVQPPAPPVAAANPAKCFSFNNKRYCE